MTRIVVTRPEVQAGGLAALLHGHGLETVIVPTVAIEMASSAPALDAMLDTLAGAAWLVLTSANGAVALVDRLTTTGKSIPEGVRVAAVGPATAAVLSAAGVRVAHVPDQYRTVAIADGLGDLDGRRVVLARADAATPALREALLARGAMVEEVIAYQTIEGPASSREPLATALRDDLAGLAFTSSSTVRGLMQLASPTDGHRARALPAFCIGPVTAATASRFGFDVAAVAAEYTAEGLAVAIADYFDGEER